jgi:hypothetical protein
MAMQEWATDAPVLIAIPTNMASAISSSEAPACFALNVAFYA